MSDKEYIEMWKPEYLYVPQDDRPPQDGEPTTTEEIPEGPLQQ